jgi:hypothetical protein
MKNNNGRKKIAYSVSAILIFFVGLLSGWLIHKSNYIEPPFLIRETSTNYKLVKPVLLLKVPEDESTPELQSLKKIVTDYVNSAIHNDKANDISIYYRDMTTDRWIGVNVNDTYAAASMLKVGTLISFYREYQDNPELIQKRTTVPEQDVGNDKQDFFPPTHHTDIGKSYTAGELISYMIIDSDNNSLEAINSLIGTKIIGQTYSDLKIPIPATKEEAEGDNFTVGMVSRLFRALFNGTYISPFLSEKALDLLSKTNYTDGIVSGVAKGITVAHKFGEHTTNIINPDFPELSKTVHELHDCGIVYVPGKPYLICVMTKGKEFTDLQKIVSDISSIIWKETVAI